MLTFMGRSQNFCDGLHRRNFLKIGAFGAGVTLADMLLVLKLSQGIPLRHRLLASLKRLL